MKMVVARQMVRNPLQPLSFPIQCSIRVFLALCVGLPSPAGTFVDDIGGPRIRWACFAFATSSQ